jgi:uncharacterized protein YqjF (DUF2071 family)
MVTTFKPEAVLGEVGHRPYPVSAGSWAMGMTWLDLLFMHWPVDAEVLRPLVPPSLGIDTFDGSAWLGVVPFQMTGVRPHFLPAVSGLSNFPEINLRTYVTAEDRPGVWFFSLDAHSRLAVRLARASFHLPYFDADMSCETVNDEVHYRSVRTHRGAPPAEFVARYRPVGGPFESGRGSIENFLTERYCLYSADKKGVVRRGEVHHRLWPLQPAEAEVQRLAMTEQIGLRLPETGPILHFSRRLDVLAWLPQRISSP